MPNPLPLLFFIFFRPLLAVNGGAGMRRETISFGKLFRFFPFGFFFLRFFETDFLRGKILIDKPAIVVVDFDFDRHFQHIDRNDRPFSVGAFPPPRRAWELFYTLPHSNRSRSLNST